MTVRFLCYAFLLLVTSSSIAQAPGAIPRNVDDILAVLNQYHPDSEALDKLRAQVNAKPPDSASDQELAVFFHRRGRANKVLGNAKEQIADFERALDYVLEGATSEEEGLGDRNRILLDLIAAEGHGGSWYRVISISKEFANRRNSAGFWGLSYMAQAYAMLYDLDDARQSVKIADEIISSLKQSPNWAVFGEAWQSMSDRNHGLLLDAEGNHREAERRFRNAINLSEKVYEKARTTRSKSRYATAQSSALNHWSVSEAMLARSLLLQGKVVEAEYFARSSLIHQLQASGRYSHYTALAIKVLAAVLYESGRFSEAESLAREAIVSFNTAGVSTESVLLGEARSILAASLGAQGKWQEANAMFALREKALASDPSQYLIRNGDHPDWGIAQIRIGEVKKALAMLERLYRSKLRSGLSNNEYLTAQLRGFYAMALSVDGQLDKALTEFQGSVPILLEESRRTGSGEDGGAFARQMRLVWILEAYMNLLVEQRESQLIRSRGIDVLNETFRIADMARGSSVQRAMAASAARATPNDPALAALARREQESQQRFNTLSDLLNRLLSSPPELQLKGVIANLRRDIESARNERDELKAELKTRFPNYSNLIAPKPTSISEVQEVLGEDDALVSIYVGVDHGYVWVVPKRGQPAFSIFDLTETEISRKVLHLRKALDIGEIAIEKMPAFDLSSSYYLYSKLLQPTEPNWRQATNLIIVPHKALGQLPFSVLVTSNSPSLAKAKNELLFAEYRQVQWLARRVSITQIPSTSTLLALRRIPSVATERLEFIGFGDPLFSKAMTLNNDRRSIQKQRFRTLHINAIEGVPHATVADAPVTLPKVSVPNSATLAQLSRLPDTAEEVIAIASTLKANPASDVFLGADASEKNVKSEKISNRRVVVFATHGLVPGDINGLEQPALALTSPEVTGNSGEDGLLTMEEVLGLRLNADWVVLSACNTAAAGVASSEAVSGLGKAFFFAGTRSLLVSNWPVETTSAKMLTTGIFNYQKANPDSTRAQALQASMIDLLDTAVSNVRLSSGKFAYAHPMFWAPFSLVGDGGN